MHTHTHTHTLRSIAWIWHIRRKLRSSRSSSVTPKKFTAASSKLMQICPFRVERVNAQKHTNPCMQGHTHTHTHTRENTDNVNTYAQMDMRISIYKCQAALSLVVSRPNVSSNCHGGGVTSPLLTLNPKQHQLAHYDNTIIIWQQHMTVKKESKSWKSIRKHRPALT